MSWAGPALWQRFPNGEWPVEVEKYIEDRCRLRYHQGATREEVLERSCARSAAARHREDERRRRAAAPLPASLDLAAIARRSLERYPGHKPTQRDIAWVAERLKLAWHQGETLEGLMALADRLGGRSPASRQQLREEAERAGGGG